MRAISGDATSRKKPESNTSSARSSRSTRRFADPRTSVEKRSTNESLGLGCGAATAQMLRRRAARPPRTRPLLGHP
jgi:hypothetical protein